MPSKTVTIETATEDEVIIVTTTTRVSRRPRVVDYADILAACQVVPDDDASEAPWESCDGYEHHQMRRGIPEHLENDRGYCRDSRGSEVVVCPRWDERAELRFYRDRGASAQVARELVAMDRRRRLDALTGWISNGWEWWGVTGEYMGAHASVWGIDDPEYARDEVRHDIAREIAAELEKRGHKIRGIPEVRHLKRSNYTRDSYRARLRRNIHLFDVIPS